MATATWKEITTSGDLKQFPQIVNTAIHTSASDKYRLIHTMDILEAAERFNWKPAFAAGSDNNPFGYHALKLENPEYVMPNGDRIQMIIMNSHDRTRRFSLDAGVFRLVCTNGLVIPITEIASIKKKHIGFDPITLLKEIITTIDQVGLIAPKISRMSEIDLTNDQRESIALNALISRLGEEELANSVDLYDFLQPKREADASTDLWTTFNVVQEKLIRGEFQYKALNGKKEKVVRKGRAINGFKKDLQLNKSLFGIASAYLPA